jgi:hypothetical protein
MEIELKFIRDFFHPRRNVDGLNGHVSACAGKEE